MKEEKAINEEQRTGEEDKEFLELKNWLEDTEGTINEEIFNIFFKSNDEELLVAKNIHSILLKVNDLDEEKTREAMGNVIKYMKKELAENRDNIKFKGDIENNEEEFNLEVEKVTKKAVEIVQECCKSVEIILKGLVLFTMGKTAFDVNSVINEFFTKVDEILEQEKAEINKKVNEKIQDLIYSQIGFLEFNFEEEFEMEG